MKKPVFTKKLALEERVYGSVDDGGTASVAQPLRRSVFLIALAASLLLASTFGAKDAHACTCAGPSTPEEQLQRSDAVFSGEILDVRDKPSSASPGLLNLGPVAFDVEESWKGVSEEQVIVLGYGKGPDCGIGFREGERYLVYATYAGQGERIALTTGICSGTKVLKVAEDDLEALGQAGLELPETEEGPDESKIQEVLEAVSGGEDGLVTVQEGPGKYSTYDPKDKDKGKEKSKEKVPKKEIPKTGGVHSGTLLILGAGALVFGSGLLIRHVARRERRRSQ